ncbi:MULTISPECIES: hypothetical protein [unclassified Enterococcus]|uniref:hypothetical protein n=1 Tax=unclassified Enterococcus TaxID=2608891 RepID=UPI001CE02BFC|nr:MULTISPECIES: hypothetical protein [unclassified Enterococcus]MCA5012073.1 WG repeat-containing protein [Enterococcus sp. S23]MCA5015324.1 WG repeat-containing protein [Enterococcus sp. S22(2020)]
MKKKGLVIGIVLFLGIFVSGCTNEEEAEQSTNKEKLIKKAEKSIAERPIIYMSNNFMGLMDADGAILMDGEKERIKEIDAFSNSTLLQYTTTMHDVFYFNTESYQIFPENPELRIHNRTFENSKYGRYEDPKLKKYGLILSDGTLVKEAKDMPDDISEFIFRNDNFADVHFKDDTEGLMNNEGKMLLKGIESFDYLEEEGIDTALAVVKIDGGYGVVHDKKGLIFSPEEAKKMEITEIFPYGQRSVAIYKTEEGKYGLINQEGKVIYKDEEPLLFEHISSFSEKGLALATSYGDDLVINEAGEVVTEVADEAEEGISVVDGFLKDDTILVRIGKLHDEKYGLMNEKFEVVKKFPDSYERPPFYLGNGLFSTQRLGENAFPAIINSSGKKVFSETESQTKEIYTFSKFTDSGLSIFNTKNHDQGLVNQKGKILIEASNGSEIEIEKKQNVYQVSKSLPSKMSTKYYYDKDGELFYQLKENEQLFLSKGLIMIVKPDGKTSVHDENGYLIKTIEVKKEK